LYPPERRLGGHGDEEKNLALLGIKLLSSSFKPSSYMVELHHAQFTDQHIIYHNTMCLAIMAHLIIMKERIMQEK
jgi:hypothetical protein